MEDRSHIKDLILKIEQNFPVKDWTIDDIHIWPVLRIRLYFFLINKIENKQTQKSINYLKEKKYHKIHIFLYYIKEYLKNIYGLYVNYYLWFKKLPDKDYMFFGASSHRVNYKNKQFNRYFDVWIDKNKIKDKSIFFEYDLRPISNQYNLDIICKYQKAYKAFSFIQKLIKRKRSYFTQDEEYSNFIKFLSNNKHTKGIEKNISKDILEKWYVESFNLEIIFFLKVLNKVRPKEIHLLCYYSDSLMALIVAANKLGIKTIEMQHGPQSSIHLAYGSWTNMPNEGYEMLPQTFWCWDENSKSIIDEWAIKTNKHKAIVVGNPWLNYWNERTDDYPYSNYILYSLQPYQSIEKLFPINLIKFIKERPYQWFVRLHPRQLNEKEKLVSFVKRNNIFNKINIEEATNDPLPQILINSIVHITNFSGVTVEASLLNKKTVLISRIGQASFPELIKEKKVFYLNPNKDDFLNKFETLINKKND